MYVEDVKDGKRTYRHIFIITFLNIVSFECNAIYVKDVEDRSNIPKGCNAIYVGDVEDRSNTAKGCNAMYVKDVEDRSNTPKGCTGYVKAKTESFPTIPSNPMYVKVC